MASSISWMPMPCLALTSTASLASRPITLFDLLANALGLRRRQIDLVDDRNDFQIVMQRQIGIGERLRLHALRRVHHQQRAFARLQAARNFVGEIHVARRVDQIELILVAVFRPCNSAARRGL